MFLFRLQKNLLPVSVAISISVLTLPASWAGPGDVNSINNGETIHSGTYFNTPGSRTTFQNTNGGLWLHSGDLVRGLESDINKTPTGNGGSFYLRAPGNVIRLDGNMDVSAVRNGLLYTGNGGKVFIDSAYLFQNGNIFANGVNGGLVQFNVGGMTMGSNAKITANGFGGNGGTININSAGAVNLQKGSLIDTSGKVAGTFDTNVISIEGGLVNNAGILRANGVAAGDLKPDDGDAAVMHAHPELANNPVPGPITAGSGTNDTATMRNALFFTPGNVDFRGGTIRLVANGHSEPASDLLSDASEHMLSKQEKDQVNQKPDGRDGSLINTGTVEANGALSKNGGAIILVAAKEVKNSGTIRANGANAVQGVFDAQGNGAAGGNGGTISVNAMNKITNTGLIQADGGQGGQAKSVASNTGTGQDAVANVQGVGGSGGQGGLIAFSYQQMNNGGNIRANGGIGGAGGHANAFDIEASNTANPVARATATAGTGGSGGHGGLIVFSGNDNPGGKGTVLANGGQGGKGGNASADAHATSDLMIPVAQAEATQGSGGTGGIAGHVVSPNPGSFTDGQSYSARAGGLGNSGSAFFRETITKAGTTTTQTGGAAAAIGSALSGQNQAVLATRKNEYLRHEDTALLLSEQGGAGTANQTLSGRMNDALIRTVGNPNGTAINILADAESSGNLVVSNSTPLALTNDLVNSNINPLFFNLNTLSILNNGSITNNTLWTPGVHVIGTGFHDLELALGGGHISWLANGSITNNQIVMTRGLWSGGSTGLSATQDIINNGDFINIAPNKALLSGFTVSGPLYESSHAGSLTFKAGRDITNTSSGKLESNLIFYDIHPPLNQNPPIDWPKFLNGAQMGASINLFAHRNLSNQGLIAADALTYRNGQAGADNPALTIGGIVTGRAQRVSNTGTITANGNAFFSPNEADGPRFDTNTFAATTSFNGTVDIRQKHDDK